MIGRRNILPNKVSKVLAITTILLVLAQHSSGATTTTTEITSSAIRPNTSVKCRGKNGHAMIRNNEEVYLYTIEEDDEDGGGVGGTRPAYPQLRLYPNQEIAKSCDPEWKKQPHVEIDCTGISKGAPMEYCSSPRLPRLLPHHHHTPPVLLANKSTDTVSTYTSKSKSNPCTKVGDKFCIPGRDDVYEACVMIDAGDGGGDGSDGSSLIKELQNVPQEGMMCCPFANGIRKIFFGFFRCPIRTW